MTLHINMTTSSESHCDTRRRAEAGDPGAQLALAMRHFEGALRDDGGATFHFEEAMNWYRKAAEQGNATAQFCLGNLYDNAQGVPRDASLAAHWYRKAADQGFAPAQLNLGIMHDAGDDLRRDATEAARWYRLAAVQGIPAAQYNVGIMYGKGDGVPKDSIEAYTWLSLAAFHGFPKAAAARRAVENTLDSAQVAEGTERARRYLETYARHPATLQ